MHSLEYKDRTYSVVTWSSQVLELRHSASHWRDVLDSQICSWVKESLEAQPNVVLRTYIGSEPILFIARQDGVNRFSIIRAQSAPRRTEILFAEANDITLPYYRLRKLKALLDD